MPTTVCCPNCWAWSELRKSATCKRCGTPLVLADGRRVDEVAPALAGGGPPMPPPLTVAPAAAMGGGASATLVAPGPYEIPPPPPPAGAGGPLYAIPQQSGTDWIAIARWITIGYGVVAVLGILAVGLLIRHITLPVPAGDGSTVERTFDLGPVMVFAAVIAAGIFALFAWLIQFTAARVLLLIFAVLGILNAMARLSTGSTSLVAASLGTVVVDLGWGFVLLMSIFARPRPQF